MQLAQTQDPQTQWAEISIAFVDDTGIADLHDRYMHDPTPTDVISFRYDEAPGQASAVGEIAVNVQRAAEAGPDHDGTAAELLLYVAHGFDHITGGRDDTERGRDDMRRRERQWIARPMVQELLPSIIES